MLKKPRDLMFAGRGGSLAWSAFAGPAFRAGVAPPHAASAAAARATMAHTAMSRLIRLLLPRGWSGPPANGRAGGFGVGTSCVRSSFGLSSTSLGGPSSTIRPSSMKTTLSPTSRANCISCVTISIVIPVAGEVAHDDEHLADELGVEGGRDLVEEHHVRLHHQRAGDRDPLLLAARELVRVLVGLLLEPDAGQELVRPALGLLLRHLPDPAGRERQVVDRGQVREQVELLEDDPDPLADRRDVGALARDLLALEEDRGPPGSARAGSRSGAACSSRCRSGR